MPVIDRLEEFIDSEGPFDGILGFSQGAALAASYLLRDASRQHTRNDFKCAVFFCAIQSWDLDSPGFTLAQDGKCRPIGEPLDSQKVIFSASDITSVFGAANHPLLRENWNSSTPLLWPVGMAPMRSEPLACMDIPTLHVIGAKDAYRSDSAALPTFCKSGRSHVVETSGGHEIPRDLPFVRKVAQFLHTATSIE